LYAIQFSISREMQQKGYTRDSLDFSIAFRKQELNWLSLRDDAHDFMEKGPANDPLGIQVKIAVPLLVDFLQSTAKALKEPAGKDALLRFSHAETISPFATLLGIQQAAVPTSSIFTFNKRWQACNVIPLSANIQWIVYTNGKDYLVKVLLNEQEATLPIRTTTWPYYRWSDLDAYYKSLLHGLKVDLSQDMLQYLKDLH
jgi:multiple inositol-polyphosphate phosphatase/2,3-bisphosphoglycerate 3-phosphatase